MRVDGRQLIDGGVANNTPISHAVETWTGHWNDDPRPFVWHNPAQEIIAKVRRGRTTLHQIKSATQH
ncbi:MAG: hypothetical protein NVSMB12_16680 [Acidimicrobiales bacterium]